MKTTLKYEKFNNPLTNSKSYICVLKREALFTLNASCITHLLF